MLVEASGAQPALSTDRTFEVDGGEPEPEPVAQFLQQNADLDTQNRSVDLGILELSAGNKRRYHERRLDPDDETYVLGQTDYDVEARETMRDISAVVRDGEETPAFVVSDEGEQGAVWSLVKEQLALLLIGGFLTIFGLFASIPLVAGLLL